MEFGQKNFGAVWISGVAGDWNFTKVEVKWPFWNTNVVIEADNWRGEGGMVWLRKREGEVLDRVGWE